VSGLKEEKKLPTLEFLPFDTDLFDVRCGKISIGSSEFLKDEIVDVVLRAQKEKYRHLVAKVPKEWKCAEAFLEDCGFQLIVESVELKKVVLSRGVLPDDISIFKGNERDRLIELTQQAFSSGTRFHLDSSLSPEKATELHERWIVNLMEDENIKILTHRLEGEVTGYVAVDFQSSGVRKGHIGLFAVDKKYSGRGIGNRLLKALESIAPPQLNALWAMTENINQGALKTYLGNGFEAIQRWNVFHWNT
jgi:ribosomal protein S18 acetylase RimI-like enzyme